MEKKNLLEIIKQYHKLERRTYKFDFPFDQDEKEIEKFYNNLFPEIQRLSQTESKIEKDHYGSGYASFYDAWFYKPKNERFKIMTNSQNQAYVGLVILFHRELPFYVFMEGTKSWNKSTRSAGSYLPYWGDIDKLKNPAVISLAEQMQAILSTKNLIRLDYALLENSLNLNIKIPTLLNSGGYTYFDGLFFWED